MYHVQCIVEPTTGKLDPPVRLNSESNRTLDGAVGTANYLRYMLNNHYHYVVVDPYTEYIMYRTDSPQS